MGYGIGLLKYIVKSIVFNYVPMYLFGGTIITTISLLFGLSGAESGEFLPVLIETLTPRPSSLFWNPVVGAPIAGLKWYINAT